MINDLKIYNIDSFKDHRGELYTLTEGEKFDNHIFVQDKISFSYKNVVRGLHGDEETGKLVSCLRGEIFFVVVDCRKQSSTFTQKQEFYLKPTQMIYVPGGCVNGHQVISGDAIFYYRWTHYYDLQKQWSVNWNSKELKINWPNVNEAILSERDIKSKSFNEIFAQN
jgi:dTDP-4-dehydrorhamnose 3,5-epimerase